MTPNKPITFLFTTIFILLISLTGCQRTQETSTASLKIVTTIFPPYDFARQIGGNQAEVIMLLHPGAEAHSYEPTPQDIKNIQSSDLFIYIGGENDVWVDEILDSMGEKKPDTLRLLDCVTPLTEEISEGMEQEEGEENHAAELDEHVWTAPQNAAAIVEQITERMSEKDPNHATYYETNSKAYIEQLQELDSDFREVVNNGKRKTILFGDRFPFRYFAEAYGLSYYAAFSGCSTETEASAATVAFLIDKVKEEELPVVFVIEFSNGKIADSICEATGAKKLTLQTCHNVTKDQFEAGVGYISLMKENVEALRIALN